MAFKTRALQRYHETHKDHNDHTSWFHYTSKDAKAEVLTDGYFDKGRDTLRKGDIIEGVVDLGAVAPTVPSFVRLFVTAAGTTRTVPVPELV